MTVKNTDNPACSVPKVHFHYSPILHLITAAGGLKAGLSYGGTFIQSLPYQILLQCGLLVAEISLSPVIDIIDHYLAKHAGSSETNHECVSVDNSYQIADISI